VCHPPRNLSLLDSDSSPLNFDSLFQQRERSFRLDLGVFVGASAILLEDFENGLGHRDGNQ